MSGTAQEAFRINADAVGATKMAVITSAGALLILPLPMYSKGSLVTRRQTSES
jgi:hypothetical protein